MTHEALRDQETLDAIRLAIDAGTDDWTTVVLIKSLLADVPPSGTNLAGSVARLREATKRTRKERVA